MVTGASGVIGVGQECWGERTGGFLIEDHNVQPYVHQLPVVLK